MTMAMAEMVKCRLGAYPGSRVVAVGLARQAGSCGCLNVSFVYLLDVMDVTLWDVFFINRG